MPGLGGRQLRQWWPRHTTVRAPCLAGVLRGCQCCELRWAQEGGCDGACTCSTDWLSCCNNGHVRLGQAVLRKLACADGKAGAGKANLGCVTYSSEARACAERGTHCTQGRCASSRCHRVSSGQCGAL